MTTTQDILNERRNTHGDFIQGSVTFNALMELINKNRKNIDGVQYYALTMIAGKLVRILNGNSHGNRPLARHYWLRNTWRTIGISRKP